MLAKLGVCTKNPDGSNRDPEEVALEVYEAMIKNTYYQMRISSKGLSGEYPCKPDIFEATYEKA